MSRGLFITLEGIDGAGKSSHTDFIRELFIEHGYEVKVTREPGGTKLGESLREILLNKSMSIETELLLMFAARQESVKQVIEPALQNNAVVISDRFTDSSFAYQGGGRGFDTKHIETLANWVHPDLSPDLTFLFDLDVNTAQQRRSDSRDHSDRFEREQVVFFQKTRQAYLDLVKADPKRFIVIDSQRSIDEIRIYIKQKIDHFLKQKRSASELS